MFVGSDALALAPLTRRIAYLEEGDWAVLDADGAQFFDAAHNPTERKMVVTAVSGAAVGKGNYRHFMEKELHEHPAVLGDTLRQYLDPKTLEVRLPRLPFDPARITRLTISACGSAFLAGMVGRYWIEAAGRCRCRQRIPLPQPAAGRGRRRHPHQPVGRDGRQHGGAAAAEGRRTEGAVRGERAGILHGAGKRRRGADGGGAGDRRRLDQGLHRAACGAGLLGHRLRPGTAGAVHPG
jgi:hypothetical protein